MYDLVGIGNAIVDVIAQADHAFLSKHGMHPGTMRLIEAAEAATLTAVMPAPTTMSGGSAANTCAVAAGLEARTAFIGTVADDELGAIFRREIAAAGVHYATPPLTAGAPTARCLIVVTPGGQRTMNTYLGASVAFGEHALDEGMIADSRIVYLEGYLFDPPAAQRAFRRAAAIAGEAGRQVALSLSDPFCVDRHRAAFLELLPSLDILFANEAEITSLFETNRLEAAVAAARAAVPLAIVTRSEQGSLVLNGNETIEISATPTRVVDTTGAGDAYAAGFLANFARGEGLASCGKAGADAAAAIIAHVGARPR